MKLTHLLVINAVSALLALQKSSQSENSCKVIERKCGGEVTALVLARAGSKGIKDKNLALLGKESLLKRTLRTIHECGKFDSVWVSTDGHNIAEVATAHGAKVHWRDPATATDDASSLAAVEDFLKSHEETRIVALIQCTSPFIKSNFLCQSIDRMLKDDIDCIFSVTRSHQLRWIENEGGLVSPINFKPEKRPRRQDWSGELVENGMFYFAKSELILRDNVFQNNRCSVFEIPKELSLEIDTKFDLTLAEMMLSLSNGSELFE
ncbi:hypothetical protein RUM44_011184 [Polyplax serrata]|uniref:N-acylneuraminate cytidylyltransferase n=1 Tax=Polyplax serrata TaxID=468196 RepID=A0ABR1APA7_POLSC